MLCELLLAYFRAFLTIPEVMTFQSPSYRNKYGVGVHQGYAKAGVDSGQARHRSQGVPMEQRGNGVKCVRWDYIGL